MKVYIGYECYHDYCEVWKNVTKVFGDDTTELEKAIRDFESRHGLINEQPYQ